MDKPTTMTAIVVIQREDLADLIERLAGLQHTISFPSLMRTPLMTNAPGPNGTTHKPKRRPSPPNTGTDPTGSRAKILKMLTGTPRKKKHLARMLKMKETALSFHLNKLRHEKKVVVKRVPGDGAHWALA